MASQASSGGSSGNGNGDASMNQSSSSDVNGKRKGRGLAKKTRNWGKKKLVIDFDANGRPCGGKYKKLATQLGCFVRDGISFPLTTERWDQMDLAITEKKRAQVNKENRSKEDYLHHTGKKPLSVLKKERADEGKPTDRVSMFIASRQGVKDITTKRMINELEVTRDELKEANKDTPEELENLFVEKFGEDKHGRMRFLGRGTTPTMVYGRKSGVPATSAETVASIRAEFEEKIELQKQETEAGIQAEREACRIEMELRMEAFKQKVLSQLQSKTG